MNLQALNRYYDILARDPESGIALPGYSTVGVSFALNLSSQGELLDVLPQFMQVQRGKKTVDVPRPMPVPEYTEPTSNIEASFLCGKSDYLLGISAKDSTKPMHSPKRFEEFRRFNAELLQQVDSVAARAVNTFLDNHDPSSARTHPAIAPYLDEILKGRRMVFMFQGTFVHDDPHVRQVWETYKASKDTTWGQCLVSGQIAPIAIKHRKVQGKIGTKRAAAPLVSFNRRAFESYNRDGQQGLNAPVSETEAFAYTTALNYLLSDENPNKKFFLGDTTIVYWAESEKRAYETAFASIFGPDYLEDETDINQIGRKRAEAALKSAADKVKRAQMLDLDVLLADLKDENPSFYVLGLSPVGDGRISIRFFITNLFEKIVENIMMHYRDLEIVKEFDNQPTYIIVRHILDETISKKARDAEASPLMAGSVFRAMLTNAPYPAALYYAIINRIRADMDDSDKRIQKVNYVRAAVIKAFLLRKYRYQSINPFQEVLVMSLNEQSTIPAYVLGRLFAVLERAQQDAIGDVNASIKDRYFTSACATPASAFPILLRLSQHHISKVRQEGKRTFNYDRRIQDILNLLDVEKNPIPARLTLDEQGIFVLGYYHQRKDFFTSRSQKADEPTSSGEEYIYSPTHNPYKET
jgi:CRISPR-associated protein Csd1